MKTLQLHIEHPSEQVDLTELQALKPNILLIFGSTEFFDRASLLQQLPALFPNTQICGCSTAGEIVGEAVSDNSCSITGIALAQSSCVAKSTPIENMADSFAAGERLGLSLPSENLKAVLILGPGVNINGSALINGLAARLPADTPISGGLAADGGRFVQTWTIGPSGIADNAIVALGFYGDAINFSYGTFAGWEPFGPSRKVTACNGNILYELDGEPALHIYKRYLGDYAKDLPGSGLLFPFEMLNSQYQQQGIFRTILGIDESSNSLTLAGDIDPNGYMRLMHASSEKLIDGAEEAARKAYTGHQKSDGDRVALLVSCVGRKLVMGDRIDEEIEAVSAILGRSTTLTGYYSNGEIAGSECASDCKLHNQTMTITWISESV